MEVVKMLTSLTVDFTMNSSTWMELKNSRFVPLWAEFLGLLTFMNQTADSKIPTIFSTFVSFEVSCYQLVLITRDG